MIDIYNIYELKGRLRIPDPFSSLGGMRTSLSTKRWEKDIFASVRLLLQHLVSKAISKWRFPTIGVHPNGWFIRENHFKMDDLGVPLFQENPKYETEAAFLISVVPSFCR